MRRDSSLNLTDPVLVITILVGLILFIFLLGIPLKPVQLIGQGIIRLMIGVLFLFFLNAFGTLIGLHIPINFVTASVSGFLGIPGLLALVAIEQFILL